MTPQSYKIIAQTAQWRKENLGQILNILQGS
jgi:hypothetical protein